MRRCGIEKLNAKVSRYQMIYVWIDEAEFWALMPEASGIEGNKVTIKTLNLTASPPFVHLSDDSIKTKLMQVRVYVQIVMRWKMTSELNHNLSVCG